MTNLPKWRTEKYAIWRACERFGILPEYVQSRWENNTMIEQADILSYSYIRQIEEAEQWQPPPV